MPAGTVIRRGSRVVSERLPGETGALLLHLDSGAYHRVNGLGALIWDLLTDPLEVELLRQRIAAQLDDAPGSLELDLLAFLQDLAHRGLIALEHGR